MITAEEFFFDYSIDYEYDNLSVNCKQEITHKAVEFAKLHVEAALKKVSEKATININGFIQDYDENLCVDKNSILTSYPLENIK